MDIAAVISVIGAMVTVGGLYLNWRKSKAETGVLRSEEKSNLARAVEMASGTLINALKFAQDERQIYETRMDEMEAKLSKMEVEREERGIQIRAMEYDIVRLRGQVNEWEQKYNQLRDKYNKAIEILIKALDDAHIPVPSELAHLLGDSVTKFKLRGEK